MIRRLAAVVGFAVLVADAPSSGAPAQPAIGSLDALRIEREAAELSLTRAARQRSRRPEDDRVFRDAAAIAWRFVGQQPASPTGMVAPVRNYPIATLWDIASMLAAFYAAHELGLIPRAEYERRMHAVLGTLQRLTLYDRAVFNRAYDTRRGAMMVHRAGTAQVIGWSATDLGRLLIWLRIVGTQPAFAPAVHAIVERNDFSRVVRDGYLWGLDLDPFGKPFTYQEGRIGYEQYAARGFALWDRRAEQALDLSANALPVTIMGEELPADRRRWDRLTTEPFLLQGIELGWDGATAQVVRRMVRAHEARARLTGVPIITGEDAIEDPPHYFYYYCLFVNGRAFGIDVQDRTALAAGPRWLSTKNAFALHALVPGAYSRQLLDRVRQAHGPGGWASGVYERGGSTRTPNINTAAVILAAALYHQRGEPILAGARRAAGAGPLSARSQP